MQNKSQLKDAILELGKKGLGIVTIVDEQNKILDLITDGDLRLQFEKDVDVYSLNVEDVMTKLPVIIHFESMAIKGLKILKEMDISCAPVCDENVNIIGTIRL